MKIMHIDDGHHGTESKDATVTDAAGESAPITNHAEALLLAEHRQGQSNLARCYIALTARNRELEVWIETAKRLWAEDTVKRWDAKEERDAALAREKALRKYAQHNERCDIYNHGAPCTCGLDALLDATACASTDAVKDTP